MPPPLLKISLKICILLWKLMFLTKILQKSIKNQCLQDKPHQSHKIRTKRIRLDFIKFRKIIYVWSVSIICNRYLEVGFSALLLTYPHFSALLRVCPHLPSLPTLANTFLPSLPTLAPLVPSSAAFYTRYFTCYVYSLSV